MCQDIASDHITKSFPKGYAFLEELKKNYLSVFYILTAINSFMKVLKERPLAGMLRRDLKQVYS